MLDDGLVHGVAIRHIMSTGRQSRRNGLGELLAAHVDQGFVEHLAVTDYKDKYERLVWISEVCTYKLSGRVLRPCSASFCVSVSKVHGLRVRMSHSPNERYFALENNDLVMIIRVDGSS